MAEERERLGGSPPTELPSGEARPAGDFDREEVPEVVEEPRRRLLLVSLPTGVVALPAESVVEVLPSRPYARIPGAPACVPGVMNRRGRMLTVVDLGVALGREGAALAEDHRVVVLRYQKREIGVAVKDVLQFASDWWTDSVESGEEPSLAGEVAEAGFLAPVDEDGEEQLHVIDVEAVLAPLFGGGDNGVGEPIEGRS